MKKVRKKKMTKRIVSFLLSVTMVCSMLPMGSINVSAAESDSIPGVGLLTSIGGRMFNEFTAYCISNDVPILKETFYYVLCDPSQRSSMELEATVQEINHTVKLIQQDVENALGSLDALDRKLEAISTEIGYHEALNGLKAYEDKYSDLWSNYYNTFIYTYEAQYVRNEMAEKEWKGLLTEEEKAAYEKRIAQLEKDCEKTVHSFVLNYQEDILGINHNEVCVEEPVHYSKAECFDRDMDGVHSAASTYLSACEALLRAGFEFEHEITESMLNAFEYCEKIETQMYTIHKAYATVCAEDLPVFSKEEKCFIENLYNQAKESKLDQLMVTEAFLNERKADYATNSEYNPPVVETKTQIAGKEVPCYMVRDNKSLDYILITKKAEAYGSAVENINNIYRPMVVLDQKYTDDGNYKMIASLSEMPALSSQSDLLSYLRTTKGFTNIAQGVDGILLDRISYDTSGVWQESIASVKNYNSGKEDASVNTYSTKDLKNNTQDTFIRIYKKMTEDEKFDNKSKTWTVNDVKDLPSAIAIHEGQVLDLSRLTEEPERLTIIVTGEATIIGKPNQTFTNTNIVIQTNEQVTMKDLSVKCIKYGTPIEVKAKDAKINFEGSNKFTGNGGVADKKIYMQYAYNNNPVGASSGMLIHRGASVTITGGTATFSGSCGGAGICTGGDLTILNATVTANGSSAKMDCGAFDYGNPVWVKVYSVGSGIGASVTFVSHESALANTYKEYGKINIYNSNVTAKGAAPEGKENNYAMDIGGVVYASEVSYLQWGGNIEKFATVNLSGNISGGSITTGNANIDATIAINNSNFNKDNYTITTVTAGSDGVTNKGISVKIHGSNGTTEWIGLDGLGDSKGSQKATAAGTYVGKIDYIEVKINSSNSWYPEKITVQSQYGNDEVTFYGGRWIDADKTYTFRQDDNVFKLNVKTGNLTNAGTDCDVYAKLIDASGKTTSTMNLSDIHPESNAFEKGDNADFYIYAPSDFGKVQYVELQSKSNGTAAPNWYIDDITVTQVQGKNKSDSFTVNADQWDVNDKVMSFGRESGKIGTFDIEIKTSNVSKAGTDGVIYLELIGKNGKTERVCIDDYAESYTPGNNFERGDVDRFRVTFHLDTTGIGELTGIKVYNTGGGVGADWKVDYIKVTEVLPNGSKGTAYTFTINNWIEDYALSKNKPYYCTNVVAN